MSREQVQITATIVTFDSAHLLDRAIQSILAQTAPPAEILIVDDGSTDNTREVVESFAAEIRYVYQVNGGEPAARNRSIHDARNKWVAFLDADDYWDAGHLERIGQAIRATEGRANFYFGDALLPLQRGDGHIWEVTGFSPGKPYELIEDGSEWVLMPRQPMLIPAAVFKRAAVLASGGFYEALRARSDTHIFLKIGLNQPICAVEGLGLFVTVDNDRRVTNHYKGRFWPQMRVLMYADLLRQLPNLTREQRHIFQNQLSRAYRDLAKHDWRDKKPLSAVGLGARSLGLNLQALL